MFVCQLLFLCRDSFNVGIHNMHPHRPLDALFFSYWEDIINDIKATFGMDFCSVVYLKKDNMFVRLRPLSSNCVHFRPLSSNCVHFRLIESTCVKPRPTQNGRGWTRDGRGWTRKIGCVRKPF